MITSWSVSVEGSKLGNWIFSSSERNGNSRNQKHAEISSFLLNIARIPKTWQFFGSDSVGPGGLKSLITKFFFSLFFVLLFLCSLYFYFFVHLKQRSSKVLLEGDSYPRTTSSILISWKKNKELMVRWLKTALTDINVEELHSWDLEELTYLHIFCIVSNQYGRTT